MNKSTEPTRLTPEMCSRVQFLTVKEAAEFLEMTTKQVYWSIQQNKLTYIKIDNSYRIAVWRDDYEEFLKKTTEASSK